MPLLRRVCVWLLATVGPCLLATTHEDAILSGLSVRASEGNVVLRRVAFAAEPGPAVVAVTVDRTTDGLIRYDGATDFSQARLVVQFDPEAPSIQVRFPLLVREDGRPEDPAFAHISTPPGWILEDGILRHSGTLPTEHQVYGHWAMARGLSPVPNVMSHPAAAPDANPAGDGLSNLAKFAFGLDPTARVNGLMELEPGADGLRLRWNQRRDRRLRYFIEHNSRPGADGWTVLAEATPARRIDLELPRQADYLPVEWSAPEAGHGFYRVRVEIDPALLQPPMDTAEELIRISNVEEAGIHVTPLTPLIQVPVGYSFTVQLNGAPYSGTAITTQGLHRLEVTATPTSGASFTRSVEFLTITAGVRAPNHTLALENQRVRVARLSPHVRPSPSADPWFVLGKSHGWPASPFVPRHDLHGFEITDLQQPDEHKVRVILSGGNHPVEHTGSWGHRAIIDFLLGEEPEAQALRRLAVFHVYPMVNPDGRYLNTGRGNPEMTAVGLTDHNRIWNTVGQFSTIDVLTTAMRADTGGTADILLDFHSASTSFFYSLASMMDTPLARAITARDPPVRSVLSSGNAGMIRLWALSSAGLSAKVAYTPEFAGAATAQRSLEIGRNYGLGLHDTLTGDFMLNELEALVQTLVAGGFSLEPLAPLLASRDRILAARAAGDARFILTEVDVLDELLQPFRSLPDVSEVAAGLIDAAEAALGEPQSHFHALMQGALELQLVTFKAAVANPTTTPEDLTAAIEALNAALDLHGRVAAQPESPPVVLREVPGLPATVTLAQDADWDAGLRVDLVTDANMLAPATRPALSFNGTSSHVATSLVPSDSLLGDRFTWEFQKFYRSFANNTGSSGSPGEATRFYTQITSTGGGLRTAIGNSYWTSATLGATGRWYHIAIVYDQGTVRTYVDGELRDTREGVTFTGTNTGAFALGRGYTNARWLNGYTREHRIWTVARSETELRLNRARSLSGPQPGLRAYWKVDEGTGTAITDHASGLYPGTAVNGSWQALPRAGFFLLQPLAFPDVATVTQSSLQWQATGPADSVRISAGTSTDPYALPTEWLPASNGGSIPGLDPGTNTAGLLTWIRVDLVPVGTEPAPRLQSLTVDVRE